MNLEYLAITKYLRKLSQIIWVWNYICSGNSTPGKIQGRPKHGSGFKTFMQKHKTHRNIHSSNVTAKKQERHKYHQLVNVHTKRSTVVAQHENKPSTDTQHNTDEPQEHCALLREVSHPGAQTEGFHLQRLPNRLRGRMGRGG